MFRNKMTGGLIYALKYITHVTDILQCHVLPSVFHHREHKDACEDWWLLTVYNL